MSNNSFLILMKVRIAHINKTNLGSMVMTSVSSNVSSAYRCPENSHYELCGSACPLTCFGLRSPANCTLPCVETCICDTGFVLSGTKCVPSTHCGCSYNGHYVSAGETFWADDACQRLCRCSEGGHLECEVAACRAGQHCQVVNGIRDCYAISERTCMAMGDPHYYTFDGRSFDFQVGTRELSGCKSLVNVFVLAE